MLPETFLKLCLAWAMGSLTFSAKKYNMYGNPSWQVTWYN